ncbi:MAG: DegT/DnrJ/EryC1/StrS family aminotransferase [Verrucomicrobia bacterium]|nr:DegT/DnrJ/EryC1/StrS family aminotransferase [Verrucomicrobiota bacterium]
MHVPLLDLKEQYAALRGDIDARVRAVIDSQHFILGPAVADFEAAMGAFIGTPHAVGMSSGTDAQLAILMALGFGPGDAVLTTPYTFFATAGCLSRVGARPVFVDIDPATFNLSPAALRDYLGRVAVRDGQSGQLRTPTGERLRAIIPVHLFGLVCDMDEILALARELDLLVLEDASQAIGAQYASGADGTPPRQAGTFGEAAWFSFFPSKNLGAFGDAGLSVCRDDALDAKLRATRMHGMTEQYFHTFVGGNFRLDALQAAVLHAKLPHLAGWSARRRENAAAYRRAFTDAGLVKRSLITLPAEPWAEQPGVREHHIFHQYVIRVPAAARDPLKAHLSARGVGSAIYYPLPLHLQECFANLGYKAGDFPHAEAAARESLALPIYPELTAAQIAHVAAAIAEFFQNQPG